MLLKAIAVARYFLGTVDKEVGDSITNGKLQNLLYYAQGLYVAMNDEPLFADSMEAWDLGPVVVSIYEDVKGHGSQPFPPLIDFDPTDYPPEIREFLDAITTTYGQYSAEELSEMTHQEAPWKETYQPDFHLVIPLASLRTFFSSHVEAGRKGEAVPGEPVWPTESFQFRRRTELSRKLAFWREGLRAIARRPPTPDPILSRTE